MNPTFLIVAGILIYFLFVKGGLGSADAATMEMVGRVNKDFYQDAADAGRHFGIPYRRILAMIAQESGGAFEAEGLAGERGLMQITRGALSDYNSRYGVNAKFDELWDERVNIFVGTGYLKLLQNDLGSLDKATRAYNVGAANVMANAQSGQNYLDGVLFYEGLMT